jgi:predicted nucleotidyltransferase
MHPAVRDLDYILGSTLKIRVLRALIDLQKPVSGRHAGRLASVSQKATAALDELTKLGIINKTESTGQNLYSVNEAHYLAEPIRALFRTEEGKLAQIQNRLGQALASRPGVLVGAIFGSVARGTASPDSDLDVLVVIESPRISEDVRDELIEQGDQLNTSYGSRISPVVFTADQWHALLTADDPFARSALSEAKVFFGSFAAIGNESAR